MKNTRILFLLLITSILFSCSKDDSSSFDDNLFYGKWFRTGYCNTQNNLELKRDKTFIKYISENINCSATGFSTFKSTGTFSLSGDNINFNIKTDEKIIQGTGGPMESTLRKLIHSKDKEISENKLIIEYKYRSGESTQSYFETYNK